MMDLTRLWARSKVAISVGIIVVMAVAMLINTSYETLDSQPPLQPPSQMQTEQKNQTQLIVFNRSLFEYRMLNNNYNFDQINSNPNDFVLSEDDEDDEYEYDDDEDEDDDEDDTQYFVYSEEASDDDDDKDDDNTDKENLLGDINDNDVLFDVDDLDDSTGNSANYNEDRKLDNLLGDFSYNDYDDFEVSMDDDSFGDSGNDYDDLDDSLDDSSYDDDNNFDVTLSDSSYDSDDDLDNDLYNNEEFSRKKVFNHRDLENPDDDEVIDYPDSEAADDYDYDYEDSDNLDDEEYYDENKSDNLGDESNNLGDQNEYYEPRKPKRRQKRPPIHTEMHRALLSFVSKINSVQSTWEAGLNRHLKMKTKHLKRLVTCANINENRHRKLPTLRHIVTSAHPSSFDARKEWSHCSGVIDYIRNQGGCGCCWSESVAGAASDRLCIRSGGDDHLSAVDMQCCTSCTPKGYCLGGDPIKAWRYFESRGLVTGGDYDGGCKPWTSSLAKTKHCVKECTNHGYHTEYKDDLHFGKNTYKVEGGESQVMAEIRKHGPVSASIEVYSDFMAYKGGVYKPTSKKLLGLHAIRLIGWGEEKEEPYWLIANSWGRNWGISGFFKIARTGNLCGITDYVTAGIPKTGNQKRHSHHHKQHKQHHDEPHHHHKHSKHGKHGKHKKHAKHGKRRKHRKHHK